MLAEIFMLRLESSIRTSPDQSSPESTVPVKPLGAKRLVAFKLSVPNSKNGQL